MNNADKSMRWLWVIAITLPFLIWGTLLVMPTFDDWNTLSSPNYDPNFMTYILPVGTTWRPFDAMMGYVNGINYKLYPTLNHILILLAHLGSTALVYVLARKLSVKKGAAAIATVFFYISPCMLATVLSVDALNQSYCHLFGLLSIYFYLSAKGGKRIVLWLLFVLMATFSKDNGLAWSVVAPIMGYAFNKTDKQVFMRHIVYGLGLAVVYGVVRLSLPYYDSGGYEHLEEMRSLSSKLSGLAKWLGYTWTATDFLALFHAPSRNLLLVGITFIMSAPFIVCVLIGNPKAWRNRQIIGLTVCLVIAALPNLLIAMSLMNAYSSLGMAALMVGWLLNNTTIRRRTVSILFAFYVAAALITAIHHWYMAWQTSLPGIEIAREVARGTGSPVNKAYSIIIKDDYPKYSSFCVPTDEAFGWGKSVLQITGYKWPKEFGDTTIYYKDATTKSINRLTEEKLNKGYDCVWIVGKDRIKVVKK